MIPVLPPKRKKDSEKGQTIVSSFRKVYSAYNPDQFNHWYQKPLSEINSNLVKNGPTTQKPIYDTKCSLIKPTVVKMNGKDLSIKHGCVGFKTPGGNTHPSEPGFIEINPETTAYIEMVDMEGNKYNFSNLIFNQDCTGMTKMWRPNDSSRIMNWYRSQAEVSAPIQAEGNATAEGDATTNSGGTQDVTHNGTVNGAIESDDSKDVIVSHMLTTGKVLPDTGYPQGW